MLKNCKSDIVYFIPMAGKLLQGAKTEIIKLCHPFCECIWNDSSMLVCISISGVEIASFDVAEASLGDRSGDWHHWLGEIVW